MQHKIHLHLNCCLHNQKSLPEGLSENFEAIFLNGTFHGVVCTTTRCEESCAKAKGDIDITDLCEVLGSDAAAAPTPTPAITKAPIGGQIGGYSDHQSLLQSKL
jgi:hypothetical protein